MAISLTSVSQVGSVKAMFWELHSSSDWASVSISFGMTPKKIIITPTKSVPPSEARAHVIGRLYSQPKAMPPMMMNTPVNAMIWPPVVHCHPRGMSG